MRNHKTYTPEYKAQIVKEAIDVGNIDLVARTHSIPSATLHGWLNPKSKSPSQSKGNAKSILQLKKQLADAELENKVLKELLKKTNQAWLKD